MKVLNDLDPGYFHQVGKSQHILPFHEIEAGTELYLEQWTTNFFTISIALRDFQRIGMVFSSPYHTENGGGYLLTYSQSRKGNARSFETLLRTPEVVIYTFPNCGALVVSPKINAKFQDIIKEQ